MTYRTKFIDFDARREPKTERFCTCCQRDIKPGAKVRWVHQVNGGPFALHPADEAAFAAAGIDAQRGDMYFFIIGMECARKLGLEWSIPDEEFRAKGG